ncbi:chromate transporter [Halodurantibacterium flavum]|uniref:Chromate transporter n=1 Tax=Halodurantibacterium flavum TaxID=1382802 RepID=A0ABW4S0P9_9RHOB
MMDPLIALCLTLMGQSLLAVGGLYVVLGDLQRVVVGNGWLGGAEFSALFALAQVAPGPNTIFVTLIGWRMGGLGGALAATAAFMVLPLTIAAAAGRLWTRWGERRWFLTLRAGLVPLTIGLMISSAWLLTDAAAQGWAGYAVVAAAAAASLWLRMHPVAILGCAALLGLLGII